MPWLFTGNLKKLRKFGEDRKTIKRDIKAGQAVDTYWYKV